MKPVAIAEFNRTAVLAVFEPNVVIRAQDVADRLGITPRTVYRHVEQLRERGFDIKSAKGMGFMFRGNWLNKQAKLQRDLDLDRALLNETRRQIADLEETARIYLENILTTKQQALKEGVEVK